MLFSFEDTTITQYLISEFGLIKERTGSERSADLQECGLFISNDGPISLSVVQHNVELFYKESGYEISDLETYTTGFTFIAESFFEKILIQLFFKGKSRRKFDLSVRTLEQ